MGLEGCGGELRREVVPERVEVGTCESLPRQSVRGTVGRDLEGAAQVGRLVDLEGQHLALDAVPEGRDGRGLEGADGLHSAVHAGRGGPALDGAAGLQSVAGPSAGEPPALAGHDLEVGRDVGGGRAGAGAEGDSQNERERKRRHRGKEVCL